MSFTKFFEKLPFKNLCEQFSVKLPVLAKAAPVANFVVPSLAALIVVVVAFASAGGRNESGGNNKSSATNDTILVAETVSIGKRAETTAEKMITKERISKKSKTLSSLNDLEGYWIFDESLKGDSASIGDCYFHNGEVYYGIGYVPDLEAYIYEPDYSGAHLKDDILYLETGESVGYKIKTFDGNNMELVLVVEGKEYNQENSNGGYRKINGKVIDARSIEDMFR